MKSNVKQITLCAILISMALVLSYIEHFIPLQMFVPLPGVKLGLANIVTLMALYFLGYKDAFTVLSIRCILGAVFGGGISGFAFSITGGLLAMFVMCIFKQCKGISIYGVSMSGAAAHNIGQIVIATFIVSNYSVMYYIPVLMIAGFITGTLIGIVSQEVFIRVGHLLRVK